MNTSSGSARGTSPRGDVMRLLVVLALWGAIVAGSAPASAQAPPDSRPTVGAEVLTPLWETLASEDVVAARAAVAQFVAAPTEALDWIENEFSPLLAAAPDGVQTLIAELDDDRFSVREEAQRRLIALKWLVEEPLRRALAEDPSPELRMRLEFILSELSGTIPRDAQWRRWIRVADVLNAIDSPRADALTQALSAATGTPIVDPRFPELYDQLYSQSDDERIAAVLQMVELGGAALPGLPRLIDLLGSQSGSNDTQGQRVAIAIVEALPRMGPIVVEPLIEVAATHARPEVRQRAATVLVQIGDPRALARFAEQLTSADAAARLSAIDALGKMGDAALEDLKKALASDHPNLVGDEQLRLRILHAIVELGTTEPVTDALIVATTDRQEGVRVAAIDGLSRQLTSSAVQPPAWNAVVAALGDPSPRVRQQALSAVRRVGGQDIPTIEKTAANGPILKLLNDGDQQVREAAIAAVGSLRIVEAADPLLERLARPDPSQQLIIAALGELGEVRAVEPLLALLQAGPPPDQPANATQVIEQETLRALGSIGDRRAIEPIAARLEHSQRAIRTSAVESLGLFEPPPLDILVGALKSNNPVLASDVNLRRGIANVIAIRGRSEPRVKALIAIADDHEENVRAVAVNGLQRQLRGEEFYPDAWDALVARLADSAPAVRVQAINAINVVGQKHAGLAERDRVGQRFIELMGDENPEVEAAATGAISSWGIQLGADTLLAHLDVKNPNPAIIDALNNLGDRRAIEPLREVLMRQMILTESRPGDSVEVRRNLVSTVRALGGFRDSESAERIIALLEHPDATVQRAAVDAVAVLGDTRATPALLKLLDAPESLKREVANALGNLKDPRAVEPLIAAIPSYMPVENSPDGRDFDLANPSANPYVQALGRIGRPAIEPLTVALGDPSRQMREAAAWALNSVGSNAGPGPINDDLLAPQADALAIALDDSSQVVRFYSALALGRLGDPRALPTLVEMIGHVDQQGYRYQNAVSMLARYRDPSVIEPLIQWLRDDRPAVRSAASAALAQMRREEVVAPLLGLLDDPNPGVRSAAAVALRNYESPAMVEPMLRALVEGDAEARAAAAAALGRLRDPRATDALLDASRDEDFTVKLEAGAALLRLDNPRGVEALLECLQSEIASQRNQAAATIGSWGLRNKEFVQPLIRLLDDPNSSVRSNVKNVLGRMQDDDAFAALLGALNREEDLRFTLQALGLSRRPEALEAILSHLDHESAEIRAVAAVQVGQFGDSAQVPRLIALTRDEQAEVRAAAVGALGRFGADEAIQAISAALQDDDESVRVAAQFALDRAARRRESSVESE